MISIPVNCGLIFYTSDSLPRLLDIETNDEYKKVYYMLGFTILLEHGILFLKMVIQDLIADTPNAIIKSRRIRYNKIDDITHEIEQECEE